MLPVDKKLVLNQTRINCATNFPACLQQILFALDAAFVFSFRWTGWGASACVDHLPWDSGQRRMREGDMVRGNGTGRERWSKTVMYKEKVTYWAVEGNSWKEGHSTITVAVTLDRAENTVLVCDCWWQKSALVHTVFRVYISIPRLVYTTDSLHLTSLDSAKQLMPTGWQHFGLSLQNLSIFCAKVILRMYLIP